MNGNLGRYEKTANLWDEDYTGISGTLTYKAIYVGDGTFTLSSNIPNVNYSVIFFLAGRPQSGASTGTNDVYEGLTRTVTAVNGYVTIAFRKSSNTNTPENYDTMLNKGASALPYAPYGLVWNDIPYSKLETATDVVTNLPVTLYTDGQPVSSYTLKGNTSVSGTPSPQNPITISGVGEETANLTDINNGTGTQTNDYYADMVLSSANKQKLIDQINGIQGEKWLNFTVDNDSYRPNIYVTYQDYGGVDYRNAPFHFRNNDTVTNIIIRARSDNASLRGTVVNFDNIMLNTGEEAIPFEPYGKYKISILKGLTALTPMYLTGQLLKVGDYSDDVNSGGTVTRLIRKIVLDGTEDWFFFGSAKPSEKPYDIYQFYTYGLTLGGIQYSSCISNIADYGMTASTRYDNNYGVYMISSGADVAFQMEGSKAQFPDVAAWKQYLADQYAAGTPIIVYYVLATPTTESVTVPTITTTGGEVSIDVDTTVKPSELDLTYHGWHEHQPLKRENGAWV